MEGRSESGEVTPGCVGGSAPALHRPGACPCSLGAVVWSGRQQEAPPRCGRSAPDTVSLPLCRRCGCFRQVPDFTERPRKVLAFGVYVFKVLRRQDSVY